ncbi:angiopoietin-2-like [Dendronephthya gigantea]|uniref:angiopoietin-2-like n=1 Tax=Dendronephthya gigantea TaxID=151771 RepID=UPI00106B49DB|nr:angiopoietin-2-like [Dendronephthya gigantea]
MSTDRRGWTVFQRRQDGSQDFYLGWSDYKAGFGDINGEFWLGLDKIRYLTKSGQNVLRVDLMDFNGTEIHAKYGTFSVADEPDKYRLSIGNFSGDAGDSLADHNHMQFTTRDSDNDIFKSDNCAVKSKGAWWYNKCHRSSLNGLYLGEVKKQTFTKEGKKHVCDIRDRDKINVVNCQLTNIIGKKDHTAMTGEGEWILMLDDKAEKRRNDILNSATSCAHLYNKGVRKDGVYTIDPDGLGSFQVRCDMSTDEVGWTVFQRRHDGSQDFFLGWSDYKAGFGDLSGAKRYAKYGTFSVADESDKYRLNIGSYSGDAGDSLALHDQMQFTTKNNDNDASSSNCATVSNGAWWYKGCYESNLNGLYLGEDKVIRKLKLDECIYTELLQSS